ncbi:hypothetical protein PRIPAC_73797 [Pristionchus pacificus]|uniref:PLAT domain-containing protein n=1 Tax=Pristionchus pacificus TaxID=54126 RepID=A0A2A6C8H6_PRIPA|nr:hypothetical protein PRIPAC_73797 [Pristionchus pacificus]|eukprot:PDM74378.1 hypothetical protein PRIPAC_41734 [Pristionchus pacificus]
MLLVVGIVVLFRGIVATATWDVIIKTCDVPGAGTDASVYLKIYYTYANSDETFLLDHESRNDFERGARDHFKIVVNSSDIVSLGLFWWPSLSLNQNWCVDWLTLMSSSGELCIVAHFDKWILHYKDPPTYPVNFTKTRYAECVQP